MSAFGFYDRFLGGFNYGLRWEKIKLPLLNTCSPGRRYRQKGTEVFELFAGKISKIYPYLFYGIDRAAIKKSRLSISRLYLRFLWDEFEGSSITSNRNTLLKILVENKDRRVTENHKPRYIFPRKNLLFRLLLFLILLCIILHVSESAR